MKWDDNIYLLGWLWGLNIIRAPQKLREVELTPILETPNTLEQQQQPKVKCQKQGYENTDFYFY